MSAVLDAPLPQDVQACPSLPATAVFQEAMMALVVACNGFAYLGNDLDALIRVVRVLRARPDLVGSLGITAIGAGPLRKSVPNEARQMGSWTPAEWRELAPAAQALSTACHGLLRSGGDLDTQIRAIKFLRRRPDIVAGLGLG